MISKLCSNLNNTTQVISSDESLPLLFLYCRDEDVSCFVVVCIIKEIYNLNANKPR